MNFALMTIVDPALSNAPLCTLAQSFTKRRKVWLWHFYCYIFDLELNGELVHFSWLVDEGRDTGTDNKRTTSTIQCIFEMNLVLPDSSISSGCLALRAFVVFMT